MLSSGYYTFLDTDIFSDDNKADPNHPFTVDVSVNYQFNPRFSLGIQLGGALKTIRDIQLTTLDGFIYDEVDFSVGYVGLNMLYSPSQRAFQPQALLLLNYTGGDISEANTDEYIEINKFNGVKLGAAGGFRMMISYYVAATLRASYHRGIARWKEPPSSTSISRNIDPGNWSIMIGISYLLDLDQID